MLALVFLLLSLGDASAQDPAALRQSEADFARAVSLQQKGDLEGARAAYEASLRSVPNRVDALSNLGVIYAQLGQYGEAIKRYSQALAVDSKEVATRFNLGLAYYKTEDFEMASRELAEVIGTQPENYRARLLLGLSYYQINKLPEAVAQLESVYKAEPQNVAAAYALGTAYISMNQTEKAEPLVSKVFSQIESAEAHLIVGSFYLAMKQSAKALEELNAASRFNPQLPTLHSQLGDAHLFSGDREQAIKEYEIELQNNPRNFNANVRLGLSLIHISEPTRH